jgi:hypothetical protein
MCNCTSENLEIPGLVLTHHPGMTNPEMTFPYVLNLAIATPSRAS